MLECLIDFFGYLPVSDFDFTEIGRSLWRDRADSTGLKTGASREGGGKTVPNGKAPCQR